MFCTNFSFQWHSHYGTHKRLFVKIVHENITIINANIIIHTWGKQDQSWIHPRHYKLAQSNLNLCLQVQSHYRSEQISCNYLQGQTLGRQCGKNHRLRRNRGPHQRCNVYHGSQFCCRNSERCNSRFHLK